jgi:DNA-binding protein HU-beta/integration host factor subunit alpha
MSSPTDDKHTVTKRDLATRVRMAIKPDIKLHQTEVSEVITEILDAIRDSLANGNTVELRNFGVFKIETRKQRIGRNPKNPDVDIQIPERSVVKFRAGKELKELLASKPSSDLETSEPTNVTPDV